MTAIRALWLYAFVLLIHLTLDAESYRDWLNYPSSSEIKVEFNAFGNFVDNTSMSRNLESSHLDGGRLKKKRIKLNRPPGGYIGSLNIHPVLSTPPQYPLSVALIYAEVINADLGSSGNLNRNLKIRDEYHRDTFHIKTRENRNDIPLVLPRFSYYRMMKESVALSCRLEIKNAEGNILGRYLVIDRIEAEHMENATGWVMDEAEADRILREYVNMQNFHTVNDIPPHLNPFSEVTALWISENFWEHSPLTSRTLQRLLLMGVWLYGRQTTVESIAASLELSTPDTVLLGGIGVPDQLSLQTLWSHTSGTAWRSFLQPDGNYNSKDTRTLLSKEHIFEPYRHSYILWTMVLIIIFSITLLIGTPLAFNTLKGAKRLHLWWTVPAISLLTAAIGWGVGTVYLPRKPIVEVTEFRLAHTSWPDTYVRDVIRILSFNREKVAMSVPANSFSVPNVNWRAIRRRTTTNTDHNYSDQPLTQYQWKSLIRGDVTEREVAHFKEMSIPLELFWENHELQLRARDNLERVIVWDNTEWHHFGKMKKGDIVDPFRGSKTKQLYGMPLTLSALFKYGRATQFAETFPYTHQTQNSSLRSQLKHAADLENRIENQGAFPNSLVVIGLSEEAPLLTLNNDALLTYSKVVWVIQLPLPNPDSEQG